MNKKGDTTLWQEFVKLIPSVIIILILASCMIKIWNATHPEQYSQEKKDILRLIDEIKDLENGKEISVPVMSKGGGYYLVAGKSTELKKAYSGCYKDYCLCFVNDKRGICETFNLRKEFGLKEKDDYKDVSFEGRPNIDLTIKIKRDTPTKLIFTN